MDATQYQYIKREVLKLTRIDLNAYKTPQAQRRLRTFLIRSGQDSWHAFFNSTRNDQTELRKLKDYLTINVSSFFRDTDKYDALRDAILPELIRGRPTLRVWSAGCSRGYEPYSVAMLLAEATGPYRRHTILATDLDHSAIAFAKAGGPYSADDVTHVPPALLSRYFKPGGPIRANGNGKATADGHYISDSLRRKITFRHHNFLADPFESGFDLIICRNVVIYFTAEVKAKLYRRFHTALRPGGIFFVGGTEFLPKAAEMRFESAGISFYRRNSRPGGPYRNTFVSLFED